jgi:hypothetical protein
LKSRPSTSPPSNFSRMRYLDAPPQVISPYARFSLFLAPPAGS